MTALHWLAYNNDRKAITWLLKYEANPLSWSYDGNLPVDVAGTMPSYLALDAFLENYSDAN